MSKFDFTINLNTILVLLGIGVLIYFFTRDPKAQQPPQVTINNYFDTAVKQPANIVMQPVINIPQPVPALATAHDTEGIIRDYFTKRFDQRMFSDSNIDITTSDTLFKNSKLFSGISYKWKAPMLTEKIIQLQPVPVNKAFAGAFCMISASDISFGPQLTLMNKREQMIGIGKDLLSKSWYASYQVKIRLRK